VRELGMGESLTVLESSGAHAVRLWSWKSGVKNKIALPATRRRAGWVPKDTVPNGRQLIVCGFPPDPVRNYCRCLARIPLTNVGGGLNFPAQEVLQHLVHVVGGDEKPEMFVPGRQSKETPNAEKLQAAPALRACYSVRKPVAALYLALGIVLLVLNVLLLRQNSRVRALAATRYSFSVAKGSVFLPPIRGVGIQGEKLAVTFGRDPRKTLLLVFSPGCDFCELNWPHWRRIAVGAEEDAVRLVYICLSSTLTADYAKSHGIQGGIVLARLDFTTDRELGLHLTPQTILLTSEGEVEHAWSGLLSEEEVADIQADLRR
jgi:hypothetical protein